MTYELGSIILLIVFIIINIIGWIRSSSKASQKAESGDALLSNLNGKFDALNLDYTDSCARAEENFKTLNLSIHNGISDRLDKIVETQDNQWKHINENTKQIAVIKAKA